jgi:hypothetical protein
MVWLRSIPSISGPTRSTMATRHRKKANGIRASARFIPLLLAHLVGKGFVHLAHETEVNVVRRDSHIKWFSLILCDGLDWTFSEL